MIYIFCTFWCILNKIYGKNAVFYKQIKHFYEQILSQLILNPTTNTTNTETQLNIPIQQTQPIKNQNLYNLP